MLDLVSYIPHCVIFWEEWLQNCLFSLLSETFNVECYLKLEQWTGLIRFEQQLLQVMVWCGRCPRGVWCRDQGWGHSTHIWRIVRRDAWKIWSFVWKIHAVLLFKCFHVSFFQLSGRDRWHSMVQMSFPCLSVCGRALEETESTIFCLPSLQVITNLCAYISILKDKYF